MKRSLILLSLFAVPGMLTSCKDEAATPDHVAAVVEKSAPEQAAEVSQSAVLPTDESCEVLGVSMEEQIDAANDGCEGKIVDLDNLKARGLLKDYYFGACEGKHVELMLQCIDMGVEPNYGFGDVAQSGDMYIVQLLLEKGATDYDSGLQGAAAGGHMDIVQLMLEKGATNYDLGLIRSAGDGHMDIVQLMIEKGATDYDSGLQGAAAGGHMDIVQLMLEKGATNYDSGLNLAAYGGHMDIVQLMLEKGADPNSGLIGAATGGHVDIVQLMLDKGATNLDSALQVAEGWGHTECAELIRAAMKK